MLLLHSLWLCFTFLSIQSANVTTTTTELHDKSSIIPNVDIQNGTKNVVISSDSGVAVTAANSRLSPKNESIANNASKISAETKHLRVVTNTSGFPDQLPSSESISTTNVSSKNESSHAIASIPTMLVGNSTSKNLTYSALSSTTTSTKAPTTSTTTTTTEVPKKPTVTFSVEDQPDLWAKVHSAKPAAAVVNEGTSDTAAAFASPPIEPISLQSSETISLSTHKDGRAFIVPMVAIIFIIPILVILANFVTRQLRDYWSKRKYRRMDYLIEEMYN